MIYQRKEIKLDKWDYAVIYLFKTQQSRVNIEEIYKLWADRCGMSVKYVQGNTGASYIMQHFAEVVFNLGLILPEQFILDVVPRQNLWKQNEYHWDWCLSVPKEKEMDYTMRYLGKLFSVLMLSEVKYLQDYPQYHDKRRAEEAAIVEMIVKA